MEKKNLFEEIKNKVEFTNICEMHWNRTDIEPNVAERSILTFTKIWIKAAIDIIETKLDNLNKEDYEYVDSVPLPKNSFNQTAFPMIGDPRKNLLSELRHLLIRGFMEAQATSTYCKKSKGYHAGWRDAFELAKQVINVEIMKDQ